jgi:ferric enterobactin receptor
MLQATDGVSRISLAPSRSPSCPAWGERDIFRAFQSPPGVASSETSSRLFARGGRPDQTHVEYDSFRVYQVDHLFGYFSAFNESSVGNRAREQRFVTVCQRPKCGWQWQTEHAEGLASCHA